MKSKPVPKSPRYHMCEHCRMPIKGDGGSFILPYTITGMPTRKAWAHSRCVKPLIAAAEAQRLPITPAIEFVDGVRRVVRGER